MADPIQTTQQQLAGDTSTGTITRFPAHYGEQAGNWMLFTEYKYQRPSKDVDWTAQQTSTGTIALPLPAQLQTSYNADWDQTSLGAWGNFVNSNFAPKVNNIIKDMAAGQNSVIDSIKSEFKQYFDNPNILGPLGTDAAKAIAADSVTGSDVFTNMGVAGGYARNPFIAAYFRGVGFRSFTLNWKFSPETFDESKTLHDIVKKFKHGMHPSLVDQLENNLFEYPNIYGVAFTYPDYLFNIGKCIIRNVTLDYHAEGVPSYHYKDGKKIPTTILVSMDIQEIEINTKETIRDGNR